MGDAIGTNTVAGFLLSLVIAMQAAFRFHTPVPGRSTTTALRYYTALLGYVGFYWLVFFVVSQYPDLVAMLLTAFGEKPLGNDPSGFESLLKGGSPESLTLALVATTGLIHTPALRPIDERVMRWFREFAAIPYEALRLSAHLRGTEFAVPPSQPDLRTRILASLELESAQPLEDRPSFTTWEEIESLVLSLRSWEGTRSFSSFRMSRDAEFARVFNDYERLSRTAKALFRHLAAVTPYSEDPRLQELVQSYEAGFQEDCERLLRVMTHLISQAVLSRGMTHAARLRHLGELGFSRLEIDDRGRAITGLAILSTVLLVIVVVATGNQSELVPRLSNMLVIVMSTVTAVTIAWFLHRRHPRQEGRARPYPSYIGAALLSSLVFIPVRTWVRALSSLHAAGSFGLIESWQRNFQALRDGEWPFLLITFVATAIAAFCLDNREGRALRGFRLRVLESSGAAALMVATAWLVMQIRLSLGVELDGDAYYGSLHDLLLAAAIQGALIGLLVPDFERSQQKSRQRQSFQNLDLDRPPVAIW